MTDLGRVVVLTASFGGRDLPLPAPEQHDIEYFCRYSDQAATGWINVLQSAPEHPRRRAREFKTLALDMFPDADTLVWIDGRVRVTGEPLRPLLEKALQGRDIAGYPHALRNNVHDEADICKRLRLDPDQVIKMQLRKYRRAGFNVRSGGLWETGILVRRNTESMRQFGRAWWGEICKHSIRDQLSFPFLLWKHEIECGVLGTDIWQGSKPHFEVVEHAKEM